MKQKINLLVLMSILFCSVVFSAPVEEAEFGDSKSPKRIIIATEKSDYKDKVVEKIVKTFEKDGCYIKIINLEDIKDVKLTECKAFLIINTYKNGQLNENVNDFLAKTENKSNVIVLTTSNLKKKKQTKTLPKGVDAIATASKVESPDAAADEIISRIEKLVKNNSKKSK